MHIGDLRVALLNYLVATQRKEPFLVRIADTDKAGIIEGKDTEIMQILEKFAIVHDQVYHQSEHLRMHQTLAIRLLEEDKAFVCICSADDKEEMSLSNTATACSGRCPDLDKSTYAQLKESGEPFVIRIKKPQHPIIYNDLLGGEQTVIPEEMESFVILQADGTPTEAFASACDDMLDNISLVITDKRTHRGVAEQIHIKQMLGYDIQTEYLHLPDMLDRDGKRITGKESSHTVKYLFEQGFIPDAILNYLLLLSNPGAPKEIFYFPEALTWFKPEDIPQAPIRFDMEKLRTLNREHLRSMDDKRLSTLFGFADADIGKLAKLYLEEAATINELAAKIRPILAPKVFDGPWEAQMRQIQHALIDAPMFRTFDELKQYVTEATDIKEEALLIPLRLLLTGSQNGPDLEEIYPYIRSYLLEVIS
jgi:glutamyl-tRNA synthetase